MHAMLTKTTPDRPSAATRPRAAARPARGELLQRKSACACGGGCPRCRAASAGLTIGAPNDRYEQEADRVAERVMRAESVDPSVTSEPSEIQRKCAACDTSGESPSSVQDALRAPGRPLAGSARSFFEPLFGRDFSEVRVHTDATAARSARDISAHAYTVGRDIMFADGQFAPDTSRGRRLLAHELTHVAQQSGGGERRISREPEEEPASETETDAPQSLEAAPGETATELGEKPAADEADPCVYKGKAVKDREIHLNLAIPAVRVFQRGSSHVQFDNIIIGPNTSQLARQNGWCHMYPVQGHQRLTSKKGLVNFVNYCGNFGFHSNFWNKGGAIERIPGSQSHGCARLHDADAKSTASDESNKFFNLVQDGDCVRLYHRSFWRTPSFKPCKSDGDCSLDE